MAVLTGGTLISEDLGIKLESVELTQLGQAEEDRSRQGLAARSSKAPARRPTSRARVEQIRDQIEKTDSDYDREKFQERLAKLTGGVAIISVGAATEAEMKQTKARMEDALHATRAAVEEGILPGGGVALLRAIEAVERGRRPRATRRSASRSSRVPWKRRSGRSPTTAASTAAVVADEVRQQGEEHRLRRQRPASTSTCSRPASSIRPRS